LRQYNTLEKADRPNKIRKVMMATNVSRGDLIELNDLFVSEGLQREIGTEVEGQTLSSMSLVEGITSRSTGIPLNVHGSGDCQCVSCPYKVELERIELFYKDVFHLNTAGS